MVSFLKAQWMVEKGYLAYLALVYKVRIVFLTIEIEIHLNRRMVDTCDIKFGRSPGLSKLGI